jgi:hypothetical protein
LHNGRGFANQWGGLKGKNCMSLDRRSYEEKRGFLRVPVDCEVTLARATSGERFTAAGKNLSANGVLFHTDQRLERGEQLEMHIEAGQPMVSVLDATIEVVRVERLTGGQSYAVGGAIRALHGK